MNYKNKTMYGIITGRPIDLEFERAPSFENDLLRACAKEYYVYQIVDILKYLISNTPIDKEFWWYANYSNFEFEYKGEKIRSSTNHGSEACMKAVFRKELDISDWILDLSKLLGMPIKDREDRDQFKAEIQERTKYGIERKYFENQQQLDAILNEIEIQESSVDRTESTIIESILDRLSEKD